MWRMYFKGECPHHFIETTPQESIDVIGGKCVVYKETAHDLLLQRNFEDLPPYFPPAPPKKLKDQLVTPPDIPPVKALPLQYSTTKVPIVIPTYNRKEMAVETLNNLLRNTYPGSVEEILIVDGSSEDGTYDALQQIAKSNKEFKIRLMSITEQHVVHSMQIAYKQFTSEWIAKIDSDTMVPPGWLEVGLQTIRKFPTLHALGIEAVIPTRPTPASDCNFHPCNHIGGVGLIRRSALEGVKLGESRYFGWTEHQYNSRWPKGWLNPAINMFLLDRLPFDPWRKLTQHYIDKGWQRSWNGYKEDSSHLWKWKYPGTSFKVVILSAEASNLKTCVASLLRLEPQLRHGDIIVVDDGARADWPDAPVTWVEGIKPFIFARNANLGIRAAGCDVILMNDDAVLETPSGFTNLATFMRSRSDIRLCSPAIDGPVCNLAQKPQNTNSFREVNTKPMAFVCMYIPQATIKDFGYLDERFIGYGREDIDYGDRIIEAKAPYGVHDACYVRHLEGTSTYRKRKDLAQLVEINQRLYREKHLAVS